MPNTHLVFGSLFPAHLYADSTPSLVTSWRVNIKKEKAKHISVEIPKETDVIAEQKWFQ